ncbi:MAG TPA: AAA family ATPase [Acidimicrobiales bacterium]|nr:AAA family ATPase [Acidimicrobiales bacterium]
MAEVTLTLPVTNTSPAGVPLDRINAAIAAGEFELVRAHRFYSLTPWDDVKTFISRVATVKYEASIGYETTLLAETEDSVIALSCEWGDEWTLICAVRADARAQKWIASMASMLPEPPPPPPPPPRPDNMVPVMFWMQNPMTGGAYARRRDIEVQKFEDVAENYPASTRAELAELMALEEPGAGGKLVLFHGPPGTGKTRAILSLISEWRDWCAASVVTDADRFFGDPTYLNDLLFDSAGRKDWLLLVIEDGDEFMNVGSRESKGQDVARLLNVADGIIGQGLNVLTLITTNVAMDELNPAVVRTGRCMSNLQFPGFGEGEAAEWLEAHGVDYSDEDLGGSTLAELYELVRRTERAQKALARFAD